MERRSHRRKPEAQSVEIFWSEGRARFAQPAIVINSSPRGLGVLVKLTITVGALVTVSRGKQIRQGMVERRSLSARGYTIGIELDSDLTPVSFKEQIRIARNIEFLVPLN